MIPVAGDFIQLPLRHIGRLGQQIAPFLLLVLHPALEGLDDPRALGQDDGQSLADDVHGGEILQLPAQLVVVPLEGLGLPGQVLVQLLLLGEGHTVDPLEGLAAAVAPPVGGVAGGELDGVALDPPGGIHVGAGAEVGELALLIKGDDRVLGQVVDKLHLVGLAPFLHEGDGLPTGQLEALQLQLLLADLPHLGFQLRKLGLGEGLRGVKIVVKAVVDAGADGQLHLRVQALHGLCKDVGAGVPVGLAVGLVFKGVQVFFAHGENSFPKWGQKNFTPADRQG